jgi:hypothetical protein
MRAPSRSWWEEPLERTPSEQRSDLGVTGLVLGAAYLLGAVALAGPGAILSLGLPFLLTCAAAIRVVGRRGPLDLFDCAWPLLLWPLLYLGAVHVVERVPWTVDPALVRLDHALLGPLGVHLGGPVEELANAVYVSYYVGVPAGFCWLWWTGRRAEAAAYTTALLGAFLACALVWLALPAGGPHPGGAPDGPAFGPFTALMRHVYAVNPHHAAALPSSHVAIATAAAVVAVRSGAPRIGLLWPFAMGWATVFGGYHYVVDTPPALLLGALSASLAMRRGVQTHGSVQAIVIHE